MVGWRMKNRIFLLLGSTVLFAACYGWFRLVVQTCESKFRPTIRPAKVDVSGSGSHEHGSAWYQQECFSDQRETLSISNLADFIERWRLARHRDCKASFTKLTNIYNISKNSGQIVLPKPFQAKVLGWFGNNADILKDVRLQNVTSVFNRYTHEHALFNPLRSKRPGVKADDDADQYVRDLVKSSSENCDFCNFRSMTAEETFGRIESTHAVTAANTFKYDALHTLVLLKSHHPLQFSEEQFLDLFDVALQWFKKMHTANPQYKFPHVAWDCLPKGSTSQVHPHAHASLNPDRYYGLMEHIRLSAREYSHKNAGQNYFTDLIQIHHILGLTTTLGEATAMAYLTPKKDHEVMIISKHPGKDFFRLLYYTMRAIIDDLKEYAWSSATMLPIMDLQDSPEAEEVPAIARIITRGPVTLHRSDISSLELFAASNVNIDPFSIMEHVRRSIRVRGPAQ